MKLSNFRAVFEQGVDKGTFTYSNNPDFEPVEGLHRFFYFADEGYFRADTITESTGLKDINGKEIFEGDIVNFQHCSIATKGKDGPKMRGVVTKSKYGIYKIRAIDMYNTYTDKDPEVGHPFHNAFVKKPENDLQVEEIVGNIFNAKG